MSDSIPCQMSSCDGTAHRSLTHFLIGEDGVKANIAAQGAGTAHEKLIAIGITAASALAKKYFASVYQCEKCGNVKRVWLDDSVKRRWSGWF